ncbi:hypothetical protein EDD11_005501 [Mortierella claussenii]|nr:hypothetical protein EDD11_005501 [Mortierella claussenii]
MLQERERTLDYETRFWIKGLESGTFQVVHYVARSREELPILKPGDMIVIHNAYYFGDDNRDWEISAAWDAGSSWKAYRKTQ